MRKLLLILCYSGVASALMAQLPTLSWSVYTVKDPMQSAGFIDCHDLDGDGKKEILLSTLMEDGSAANQATTKGAIRRFTMGTSISSLWSESVLLPTDSNLPFINYPQVMDVDEDGNMDILVQQGFLNTNGGSHQWLKGPSFTQKFAFAPDTRKGYTDYFWHESVQWDLDGDGLKDVITTSADNTVSPADQRVEWYRHLGNGQFAHYIINDSLGGVFIRLHDIDGDSDMDIVVSDFFGGTDKPALVWLEQQSAPSAQNSWQGVWAYHTIDHTTGLGYYFDFYDIDNDGSDELVYANHNNMDNPQIVDNGGNPIPSGVYWFEIPSNPASVSQWQRSTIGEGFEIDAWDFGNPASQGSPGIFDIGDVDGNGLADVVVPGDGTDSLFLFRQLPNHTFQRERIANGRMFGMAKITDLDGDGSVEIVAAMHNFPEWYQVLAPPPGHLKIYKPSVITGVAEALPPSVIVFPVPAADMFTVKTEVPSWVNVYSFNGQLMFSQYSSAAVTEVSCENWPAGEYMIEVVQEERSMRRSVIVSH